MGNGDPSKYDKYVNLHFPFSTATSDNSEIRSIH